MSYQIIEKEHGNRYLIFEEKEYFILSQRGKFLRVYDRTIENNSDKNIFNLETGEFLLKEWVYGFRLENFGLIIYKDGNSWFYKEFNNFISYEAGCKVFKEGVL